MEEIKMKSTKTPKSYVKCVRHHIIGRKHVITVSVLIIILLIRQQVYYIIVWF